MYSVDIAGRSSFKGRHTRLGWGKQAIFEQKCVNISKTVGSLIPKLLSISIGSCICAIDWHHDRWPWMTLNYYKFEFWENFAGFRRFARHATTAKRMKIDPHCQRQRCNPYKNGLRRGARKLLNLSVKCVFRFMQSLNFESRAWFIYGKVSFTEARHSWRQCSAEVSTSWSLVITQHKQKRTRWRRKTKHRRFDALWPPLLQSVVEWGGRWEGCMAAMVLMSA